MEILVYSDGSATQKHLPGGYGWVMVIDGKKHSEGNGHIPQATNNDAELEAAIHGLAAVLKYTNTLPTTMTYPDMKGVIDITLISDSQITLNWANGTYKFKQEAKMARFEVLKKLMMRLNAKTRWVQGHSGDEHNERCDELANMARLQTTEKPKKSKKETKKFRWNDYLGMSGASPIGVLKEIHKDNRSYTLDALIAIMLELVELEESRKR